MGTQFITVKDEYVSEDWPDSSHTLVTSVQGDLADRIRARADMDGEVRIFEDGQEGGYSEYTIEWEWCFTVKVGNEEVFRTNSGWDHADFTKLDTDRSYNALAHLMRWLDGGLA